MRGITIVCGAVLLSLAGALPTEAHHSASQFDFLQNRWAEGVVKEVRVINPHMSLTLLVSGTQGAHEVLFEGHSVNNFYRAGWRAGMIAVGDTIRVRFNPRKDGTDGGFVNGFVTAHGQEVTFKIPGIEDPGIPAAGAKPAGK